MISSITLARSYGRAYGNVAMGLDAIWRADEAPRAWLDGLAAAVECIDPPLMAAFEQGIGQDGSPLLHAGPDLSAFEASTKPARPRVYAWRAGVNVCLPASWKEWELTAQAETAASLAWAEARRRADHRTLEAAKSRSHRHALLQACILPDVRRRLDVARDPEAGLLSLLAAVCLHDLGPDHTA